MVITKRMDIVRRCDALGIDYQTYINNPKWWNELMWRKRIADHEHTNSKTT